MPYNGSGIYTIPGAQLVNGEIVSATENNQSRNDFAAALNTAWTRDGQSTATGNIPMGNHKLTGMLAGSAATDSINLSQAQGNAYTFLASVTGTDTIAASVSPSFAAYTAGQTFRFVSAGANTNATTLNINSLGAKAITKLGTTALIAGDIPSGSIVEVVYDGTQFQLVGLVASTATTATNIAGGSKGRIPVQSASGSTVFMDSSFGFKNRIINGAMMIDQRNAGASVTPVAGSYTVDRWAYGATQSSKFTAQKNSGSVTPPSGFINYLGFVSSSSYSVGSGDYFFAYQPIEGLNTADLGWGAVGASAVTLSFWVRSSLTGTFGGSLRNSAGSRSYPFTYTISSAGTWEQKSITIPGDTAGTWLTTNGIGITLGFGMGVGSTYSGTAASWASANYISATGATSVVGTNGATFYITGVQLEKCSTATSFDYRPYGTELALCQRYYEAIDINIYGTNNATAGYSFASWLFKVNKRVAPTISFGSGSSGTTNTLGTNGLTIANLANNIPLIATGSTANSEL